MGDENTGVGPNGTIGDEGTGTIPEEIAKDLVVLTGKVDALEKDIGKQPKRKSAEEKALNAAVARVETGLGDLTEAIKDPSRLSAHMEGIGKLFEDWEKGMRVAVADFAKASEQSTARAGWTRQILTGVLIVLAIPISIYAGIMIQKEWEVVTTPDPTGGWKDLVWRRHGRELVDCIAESDDRGVALPCEVEVKPVRRK